MPKPAKPAAPRRDLDALQAAASLLLGHFTAEARRHLVAAGDAGAAALAALDAGADAMAVRRLVQRARGIGADGQRAAA